MTSPLPARVAPFVDGEAVQHVVRANAGFHPLVPVAITAAVIAVVTATTSVATATGVPVAAVLGAVLGAAVGLALIPLAGYRLLAVTDGSVVSLRTARFSSTQPVGVVGREPRFAQAISGAGDFRRVECGGERLWVHQRFVAPLSEPAVEASTDPDPT
jgi:hypothetical protein